MNTVTLNIKKEYTPEVLVCGLGPAGLTAAVLAARNGVKVLGIDKCGFAGGNITAGFVNAGCGMCNVKNGEVVVGGLTYDICKNTGAMDHMVTATKAFNPIPAHEHQYNADSIPIYFDIERFKYYSDCLLLESGVELLFHTRVFDVVTENGKITTVLVANKDGLCAIKPKTVIDCTGDGDIAAWSGAPFYESEVPMPGSAMFTVGNLDTDLRTFEGRQSIKLGTIAAMKKGYEEGRINLHNLPHPLLYNWEMKNLVSFNNTKVPVNCIDAKDLTRAEIEGRKQVHNYMEVYKDYVPEFKDAQLVLTGPNFGPRESRHIEGLYTLSEYDIVEKKSFYDGIGKGAWHIDPVGNKAGLDGWDPERCWVDPFDIPYRTLVPQKVKNLIVAGRCHSATLKANGSTRVSITAMLMGEAAGVAASLCVKNNVEPKDVDITALRQILKSNGSNI